MTNNTGVLVSHLDKRPDLVIFIKELSLHRNLTLFISEKDQIIVDNLNISSHIIDHKKSNKNKFLSFFYNLFYKRHKLKKNHVLYRLRRIGISNKLKMVINLFWIYISENFSGLLSYEKYLSFIDISEFKDLKISSLLVVSIIEGDSLVSFCFKKKIPINYYLYSWDHPFKENRIGNLYDNIFVWSEGLKNDLIINHSINENRIKIIGSTQLIFLDKYIKSSIETNKPLNKYIYIVMAQGREELINQELEFIERLKSSMKNEKINLNIVVRIYPNLLINDQNSLISRLDQIGVTLDDGRTIFDNGEKAAFEKFSLISNADLIIHTGTTVGIESLFLNDRVVFFNFGNTQFKSQSKVPYFLDMKTVLNQHHLRKYFVNEEYNMVAGNIDECINIVINNQMKIKNRDVDLKLRSTKELVNSLLLNI